MITTLIIGGSNGIGKEVARIEMQNLRSVVIVDTVDPCHDEWDSYYRASFPWKDDKKFPPGLVNEADRIFITIGRPSGRLFVNTDMSRVIDYMEANFQAVASALRACYQVASDRASYVVVSSVSAQRADQGGTIYAAGKAAVDALVRGLAREWVPARVNAVAPGPCSTDQFIRNVPEDQVPMEMGRSPHGRLVTPIEVAEAMVALANLTGVSGIILPVDLAGLSSSRRLDL